MASCSDLLSFLSPPLLERARLLHPTGIDAEAEYVLYWMRTAVRCEENPALNVAIEAANHLNKPLLVYHALSESYPFASDRHHTFILQGARDVQAEFFKLGIPYVFHLERPGHRGPHLHSLAKQAALLVTEEMPVAPLNRWTQSIARHVQCPMIAVDTACVLPMQMVGKAFDRAFAFRSATESKRYQRLSRPIPACTLLCNDFPSIQLPFEPLDLQQADIASLVATCEIDHSVGPVPDSIGGSTAGYSRWEAFKQQGLRKYDRLRNNPLVDGISRMSPYLHYGMVSPMRIAREAREIGGSGAEKFLDELLIWRELAYAFCFYRPDHDSIAALPDWAVQTLQEHESDPRDQLLSWESMARGESGDLLWDAMQKSLLIRGELHNNVRMTWGKAILGWTPSAKVALERLIDLNHRYALDGRDPASYGGLLWCLGQFDRPFLPENEIAGTVRGRSTAEHAQRLNVEAYKKKVTRSLYSPTPSVAVIGAGLSGLICARTLADHKFEVTIFDKSRGVGGRMSTRRTDTKATFDHGAQYFTARNPTFRRYVDSWMSDNIVRRWDGRIVSLRDGQIVANKGDTERFVAVPGMSALGKHLSLGLNPRLEQTITSVQRVDQGWSLGNAQGESFGNFDYVVVATPAPQAIPLLASVEHLADEARRVSMQGCWAVMIAFDEPLDVPFDAAFVESSPLSWIARDSSKPSRDRSRDAWVLHASSAWSDANLESTAEQVQPMLLDAFWTAIGVSARQADFASTHRWRYALASDALDIGALFDPSLGIGACGDWCAGNRVEGAFVSGVAVAGRILGSAASSERQVTSVSGQDESRQLKLF